MKARAFFIAAIMLPGTALAGETAWQQVAPGVNMRLISAGQVKAGSAAWFGLEIDMPDDTKTYWRVPGETGFPTQLDVSAARGVDSLTIHWPYPTVDQKPDYLDYAYYGHTILPMEAVVSDATGTLDVEAILGVCAEICVPARARFVLPLADATADAVNGLRIRQALAEAPTAWTLGAEPLGRIVLLPDAASISLELHDPALDPASLIVSSPGGTPLFGAPQKSPQPNLVVLPILGKTDNIGLPGTSVQVTFMTDMGAFEVSRTILDGD